MLSTVRKLILVLIVTAVVVFFGLLGFNVYLNYKKTSIKEQAEKERQEAKKQLEEDEKLKRDIAEMTKQKLTGWTPPSNSYSILSVENINHLGMIDHETIACQNCNSCQNCQAGEECLNMQPKLIFTRKVKEYIHNVLDSIIKHVNSEELGPDNYNDNVTPFLKRYNAVLYGAPGTGKTELVNELVHHLHEKFSNPEVKTLTKEIEQIETKLEKARQQQAAISKKSEETTKEDKVLEQKVDQITRELTAKQKELSELQKSHWVPPVFKIDGVQLQTGGAVTDQPNPEDKLRMIIEKCKKQYFDNAYSDKPYIVFIEEADQGKNVMTAEKGKLLEEFKNFLSTSEDKAGLKAKAQDPNSIIIIATNNFDQIDPAVVRRGRLGEKLNFN
ncbi:11240_t:CDS:1 [Racocetra fulgida]|uniref:11240_t:CDS:1 n=1 Tax=Racocetra fulgida TaxID=60492 RepID=A0A9N8YQJ9_9GLOM|nr:11240_t:CDS:1 [Racocetra fulgida]